MNFRNKNYFLILMTLVIIVSIPFVIHSFVKKSERTEGLQNDETSFAPSITPASSVASSIESSNAPQSSQFFDNSQITVDKDYSYFDDALFIGDSRTDALKEYGTIKNADYYCYVGLSVYNIDDNDGASKSGTGLSFNEYIKHKKYKKVYVMLGFNEVGYDKNNTLKRYSELLDRIQAAQPDSIIYIEANLLVTAECSRTDKYSHNPDILQLNNMLSTLADNNKRFYIDINELFGDGNGNMREGISGDGTHPYAKYYSKWCEWLLSKAI